MRAGGGAQALLFVLGYLVLGGRALDYAGLHASAGNSLGKLGHIDVGYLADRALLEVCRVAEVFLVEAGRADELDAGRTGRFCHEVHVASDVHGTWVEKGAEAEVAQFLEPIGGNLEGLFAFEARRRAVQLPSAPSDHQMLVHQRGAQLIGGNRSRNGVDGLHGSHLSRRRGGPNGWSIARLASGSWLGQTR